MRPDEKKHLLWIMLLTALIVVAFRIEINPIGWKYFHWANWDCGLAFFIGLIVSAGKEVVWDKCCFAYSEYNCFNRSNDKPSKRCDKEFQQPCYLYCLEWWSISDVDSNCYNGFGSSSG